MKIMTLTIMMLLSVYAKAKTASSFMKSDHVTFEIMLDSAIKRIPYLIIFEQGVYHDDAAMVGQKKVRAAAVKGNTYFFDLKKQDRPRYFSIILADSTSEIPADAEYHFEPGDQIKISIKPPKTWHDFVLDFSGRGSAKYLCKNEFKRVLVMDTIKHRPTFSNEMGYETNNDEMRRIMLLYKVIEKYKPDMSIYSYNLLHADVLGQMGKSIFGGLRSMLILLKSNSDTAGFQNLISTFKGKFEYDFTKNVPDSILYDSKEYSEFLLARIHAETIMDFGSVNYKAMFEKITRIDKDGLRDKLILSLFLEYWSKMDDDFDYIFKNSLPLIKDRNILARVRDFDNNRVGSVAQNFNLSDSKGKKFSLSDFKGKVVFIDFWYTGCGACQSYFENVLSKVEERYAGNVNVVFITISPDNRETWLESLKNGKHTSAKAINLYTNDERYDHKIIKSYNVKSYPRPMVISKKGRIASVSTKTLRNMDGLISTIEKELDAKN